ncbi:uncharacterized protein LOC143916416 [Arctopsyche grandis]|uniref:uncharacterized protein LOC143916416 n=1 Tax=Arctopsyche grandis TaxID=121162 RepID=UPI00406D8746
MSEINQNSLHLDNVVASHPELGPSPPDGGYGWVVLFCALITQLTIPSVVITYGILILCLNVQEDTEEKHIHTFWGQNVAVVPVLITVFSLLTASWSKTIIRASNRPRVVSIAGVFLLTAGVMLTTMGIDDEDNEIIYNIFGGILAGFGTSLTMEQSEILLKHYFSTRLHTVRAAYKVSVVFGNIFIPLIMGALFTRYDLSTGLFIYSAIIWQNCLVVLAYSRPTYVIAQLQQSYKMLNEAAEDEDEEIYSQQDEANPRAQIQNVDVEINHRTVNTTVINDDEQDEDVINFYTEKRKVVQISEAATSRLEPSTSKTFGYRYDEPDSLYRETTVDNVEPPPDNTFTYEVPSMSTGAVKRTTDVRKNIILLISAMRDRRFYIYTYMNLCMKLSMLILGLLYPAHVSNLLPELDMLSLVGLLMVVYIGAMCLNIIMAFLPSHDNKKIFLLFFNLMAFIGLITIAESYSKTFLMIGGIISSFSIHAIYVLFQDISEEMKLERGKTIVSLTSNCMVAMIILLMTLVHDHTYATWFLIASLQHSVVALLSLWIRKQ